MEFRDVERMREDFIVRHDARMAEILDIDDRPISSDKNMRSDIDRMLSEINQTLSTI